MIEYPYQNPQILTDELFMLHGGDIGLSTAPQRQVAYTIAEMQMTYYLDSFLVPTMATGTYFWKGANPVSLGFGNIISINGVSIFSNDWTNGCSLDLVTGGCSAVRGDGKYGYVDIQPLLNCGGCSTQILKPPYNIQIAFTSGLSTGTSMQPLMVSALSLASQINLNEMDVSLSNEGTADIGIRSFSNQKYSELRTKLGKTTFGDSASAQRVARLVRRYRTRPSVGLH